MSYTYDPTIDPDDRSRPGPDQGPTGERAAPGAAPAGEAPDAAAADASRFQAGREALEPPPAPLSPGSAAIVAQPGIQRAPDGPGEAPGVWCAQCEAVVVSTSPGRCPKCGCWTSDNVASLTHGLRSKKLAKVVDAYRVDLIAQLFAERGGRDALDVVSRIAIENYALVCAQHKTIEARLDEHGLFTQTGRRRSAFDMLKAISETIDRLRTQLPAVRTPPPMTPAHVDQMPTSALERARDLLTRLLDGETLTEREHGQLDILRQAAHGAIVLPPDPAPAPPVAARGVDDGVAAPAADDAVDVAFRTEIVAADPAPEPLCPYCGAPQARCDALRQDRPDVWEAVCTRHPAVVEARRERATREMYESFRRQRRGEFPRW